ncbi:MAG TPA: ABC transporter ATP-binding protein [Usitatibacter sp.]|nr:ABC transporter ATP-binding protein [Usitatibacter sp.]
MHLELDQLTKRYGDTVSVDGISLSVERGEFICLLGPSGCGKTTTLRMIAGFLEPDRGEIRVEGRTISKPGAVLPPERRNMGMIFQSYAVWPHMTVLQNVGYGLKMKSIAQPRRDERAMAMLKATQLDGLAHRYPSDLSGGQQQRVALARALAPQPAILLLDEPLSNLDANLRGEMRFEIRRLHDEFSGTSIYVTHDQVEAMTMADRIVVMNAGRIEQIGSPEEVYDRPRSRFVARFIGASNVVEGRRAGDREVAVGGHAIAVAHGDFSPPGEAMSFCVKTHDVELLAAAPGSAGNTLPGTVRSQAYLGSHRDYIVAVDGGQEVLVAAPAAFDVSPGTQVHVRFAAERCRGLIQ